MLPDVVVLLFTPRTMDVRLCEMLVQVAAGKGTARARSLFLLYVDVCSISSVRLTKGTLKNSKQASGVVCLGPDSSTCLCEQYFLPLSPPPSISISK